MTEDQLNMIRPLEQETAMHEAWRLSPGLSSTAKTPASLYGDLDIIGLAQALEAQMAYRRLTTRNAAQTLTGAGALNFAGIVDFPVLVRKVLFNFDFNNLTRTGRLNLTVAVTRVLTIAAGVTTTVDTSSVSLSLADPDVSKNDLWATLDLWAPLRVYDDVAAGIVDSGRLVNASFMLKDPTDPTLQVGDIVDIDVTVATSANVESTIQLVSANSAVYSMDANMNIYEGVDRKLTDFAQLQG